MFGILRSLLIVNFLFNFGTGNNCFPENFYFGTATASYQVEGGWNANGKGVNIWDSSTHQNPNVIKDRSNGDIACDSYHNFKEDVKIMKELGVTMYRFSLSWTRILPTGFVSTINEDGIHYYNDLINELIKNNIEPFVTLYHWDLPQNLLDLGGWPNPIIADYFNEYAKVAFTHFGDRVKYWTTINEPNSICTDSYENSGSPPWLQNLEGIGSYLSGHTILNAHAQVYQTYKKLFKPKQQGHVGLVINTRWYEPKTNSSADQDAATRAWNFDFGWFGNPLLSETNDYPEIMKTRIAEESKQMNLTYSRLPSFTHDQRDQLHNSFDFIGLNHYSTSLCSEPNGEIGSQPSLERDRHVYTEYDPMWPASDIEWLKDVPWGLYKTLMRIKENYNNPEIIITENGWSERIMEDNKRIHYLQGYLSSVQQAIKDGCNIKGYMLWSLIDNFEWKEGYTQKFGLYSVDFSSPNRTRTPRKSVEWYKNFIRNNTINCQ